VSAPDGFAGSRPGRVAIVGAGQVGTALGMALTDAGPGAGVEEVALHDRDPAALEASLERGAGQRAVADVEEVLSADTIVLAVPMGEIVRWLDRFGASSGSGTLVIDTGSAKAAVVDAMRRLPEGTHALGGHPIAGTERPGAAGADPSLLQGAPFVLCPVRDDDAALRRGRALAAAVGANPVEMDAATHDRVVARTSHLPHLMAGALAGVVGNLADRDGDVVRLLASTGFRGATRLAAGDPGMVAGFLQANRAEVRRAVDELIGALLPLQHLLEDDDGELVGALAACRAAREAVA
jgi:prephenate dehydrogenase